MQALRFDKFGSFDRVRLQTLPDPQPKSDELVVRIRAAALNPSDAKNILGRMEGTTLPRTPGRDFAGVVVTGPSEMIGAEVWGTGGDVGFTRDGAYAELLLVPVDGVRPKPKNLSFEEAAAAGGVTDIPARTTTVSLNLINPPAGFSASVPFSFENLSTNSPNFEGAYLGQLGSSQASPQVQRFARGTWKQVIP